MLPELCRPSRPTASRRHAGLDRIPTFSFSIFQLKARLIAESLPGSKLIQTCASSHSSSSSPKKAHSKRCFPSRRHRAREPVGPRQVAQRAPLGGAEPFGITTAVSDSPELNHQLGDRPWARFQAPGHGKIVAFPNQPDKSGMAKQLSYATIFDTVPYDRDLRRGGGAQRVDKLHREELCLLRRGAKLMVNRGHLVHVGVVG